MKELWKAYEDSTGQKWWISPSLVSYSKATDWGYWHDECDGAPDGGDSRNGHAATEGACILEIERRIAEFDFEGYAEYDAYYDEHFPLEQS